MSIGFSKSAELSSDFLLLVYEAMVAVAGCDGEIVNTEVCALQKFIATHGLDSNVNLPVAGAISKNNSNDVLSIVEQLADFAETDRQRYLVLDRLSQISDADENLHPEEIRALNLLHKKWDTDIALTKHVTA